MSPIKANASVHTIVNDLANALRHAYELMGIDDAHIASLMTTLEYQLRTIENTVIGPSKPHPMAPHAKALRQSVLQYMDRMADASGEPRTTPPTPPTPDDTAPTQ